MKHRADVLQIERPGEPVGPGRHAGDRSGEGVGSEVTLGQATADPDLEASDLADLADLPDLDELPDLDDLEDLDLAEEPEDRLLEAPVVESDPTDLVVETVPAEHHKAEAAANPTDAERAASPLTSAGKWRTRNQLRNLTFVLLVLAAAATGLAGRYYFESTTDSRMRLLITCALIVSGLWALLTATAPQVVTLKGSVLTVKSRRGTDRFDLAEGMTQLELIGEPTSSKWALVLHRGDNSVLRLNRRDVDARTLDPLVRAFREIAERRRSEHWARLGL